MNIRACDVCGSIENVIHEYTHGDKSISLEKYEPKYEARLYIIFKQYRIHDTYEISKYSDLCSKCFLVLLKAEVEKIEKLLGVPKLLETAERKIEV